MSLGRGQMLGIAAIAVLIGAAGWVMRPQNLPTHPLPVNSTGAQKEPNISPVIETDVLPAIPSSLSLIGSIQSEAQSTLSVRLPGRIVAVRVSEGGAVRAGQPLILLDESDVQSQVRQADAAVTTARSQVDRAERGRTAQKVKADSEVLTARTLWQQAQSRAKQAATAVEAAQSEQRADVRLAQEGVRKAEIASAQAKQTLASLEELNRIGGVAKNDLDSARRQATAAESDLTTARTQLQRAETTGASSAEPLRVAVAQRDLATAREGVQQAADGLSLAEQGRKEAQAVANSEVSGARAMLSQAAAGAVTARTGYAQTRLASAIDGVATAVTARVGETAQPGVPLVTVVSLSGLRAEALVPGRQLTLLKLGQQAKVAADTDLAHAATATITEIARVAEPDGRTFRVRFRLPANTAFRPGQTARITIPLHR